MIAKPFQIKWTPQLPISASEGYLRAISSKYGWLAGYDSSGEIRCLLPYTVHQKLFLKLIRFRHSTICTGAALPVSDEKVFLESAVAYFRDAGMDVIIPPSANALFRTVPDGALFAPYGSFVVDLSKSEDALWTALHSKHRNVVRKATKDGVEIKSGHEFARLVYDMVKETLARSRLSFMSWSDFEKFTRELEENIKFFVAFHHGRPHGCAAIPFSAFSADYLYGGSASEPSAGAMNLLHWEAIRIFRTLGVRRYDLYGVRLNPEKGSKQEGLHMFKERFGGDLHQGFMWKYSLRPLKAALYSIAARIRTGGDVVDQERKTTSANLHELHVRQECA